MTKKISEVDIKYIGVPNICFSCTDKDDKREKKFSKQRRQFGFDNSETWNLFLTLSLFILPRLKRFKEVTIGYPGNLNSFEEWQDILDKMIKAFEIWANEDRSYSDEECNMVEEGMNLFIKWFGALWW